ncbi:hypothetical protein BDZ94DRAFT_1250388 [Collybia nuda]|uniref:Uncharacterized protein n=1 Tax=Collybia nuda TaxID=64659 RepID=A0A9P5YFS4_9AGAR|nr:hypothetical protein BDZ94DRAFT_1250388 [Collybia nuda]
MRWSFLKSVSNKRDLFPDHDLYAIYQIKFTIMVNACTVASNLRLPPCMAKSRFSNPRVYYFYWIDVYLHQ